MTVALRTQPARVPRLPIAETVTLKNGLRLCVVERRRSPIVATSLWLPAGCRDERPGEEGAAHLLEHMMFKGASRYGPGEIDRLTQRLGGHCNAFTSHDATVYTFAFAKSSWSTALEIEADRLAGPLLDAEELERERLVVLEELAMYENDPWDALEQDVHRALFPSHPYGRPILGTRESLCGLSAHALEQFFSTHYRPDEAVLSVAGDLDLEEARVAAERTVGRLRAAAVPRRRVPLPEVSTAEQLEIERPAGRIARRLVAFATMPATDPRHAALRLLTWVLAGGRSSRLQRQLVEEQKLCAWISADLGEAQGPSVLSIAFEADCGRNANRAEGELWRVLEVLASQPPTEEELARAKRMALADWVFAHESTAALSQAFGGERALFAPGFLQTTLRALLAAGPGDLAAGAQSLLDGRCVVGKSRCR